MAWRRGRGQAESAVQEGQDVIGAPRRHGRRRCWAAHWRASTDCGLGGRVHPQIAWAKLETLAQGAAIASKQLW